jgi:hypothetical protein
MKRVGKKLSAKDFKATVESMRHWTDPFRRMVSALVLHTYALQKQVDDLEYELKKFRQTDVFDPPVFKAGAQEVYMEKGQRYWEMIKSGMLPAYLKYNTDANPSEIIREANEWARKNNKEPVGENTELGAE